MTDSDTLAAVLDKARWAPSGDNTQPWKFEVAGDLHLVLHGFDTRDHCVYDLDGRPSQMALGALIETVAIAASQHGMGVACARRPGETDRTPTFDIRLLRDATVAADPLAGHIESRSVQRRALDTRPLSRDELRALQESTGPEYSVQWLAGFSRKLDSARLMFASAKLRLTMPEAYAVHREVIEWNAQFSHDRVPDQALGVDRMTTVLMRHVMKSWERVAMFNRYFAGTLIPRLQMDFIPALACGAHFVLVSKREAKTLDDDVAAGRALQRFWLTATSLKLQLQPELTPLIFSRYARQGMVFSRTEGMSAAATSIADRLQRLIGPEAFQRAVFMGRIGAGPAARARSTRKSVEQLTVGAQPSPVAGPGRLPSRAEATRPARQPS